MIDLTEGATRAAQSVRPSHLACAWLAILRRGDTPPSWQIAQRLIAAGFAGAIVPSFALRATRTDKNVVFWKWGNALPHKVVVIDDDERLPRNDLSWS
jgi:RES domain-containing protein